MTKEELKKLKETVAYFGHWYDVIGEERVSILEKSIKYITDLEKENAELKEQIEQIEKVSDYNADQLAQAKEIIKDLMSFPVQLCDCRHTVDFEKTREKAVQFLKEIEK